MAISRRRLVRALAAAPFLTAQERTGVRFIVRSANPEDLEMPLEAFDSWITPNERFFVRTHLYRPRVDAGAWRLSVAGAVERPLTLAMDALRRFPRVELTGVLECAGNGRGLFDPPVAGTQWRYGAVGNALWTGVRLADVLRKAGLRAGAKHIAFNGADVPMGKVPDFVRSVPVEKALHPDTLLAFEMNGRPLPEQHGFPLRLIVPGWAGDSWVKWVTDIQALDREYEGFFMKTAYRHPEHPVTPGAAVDPAEMVPVTELPAKSVITSPGHGAAVEGDTITVRGAAWSGAALVSRVEVSTDNGRSWRPAQFGREQARYAWRQWRARWSPPGKGSYLLMARAFDASGRAQPFVEEWNPSGYLWNAAPRVRVEVGAVRGEEREPTRALPQFPPPVKSACLVCHGGDIIGQERLTRAQWEKEVDKMARWGASFPPGDRTALIDFLSANFGVK